MDIETKWKVVFEEYFRKYSETCWKAVVGLSVCTVDWIYHQVHNDISQAELLMVFNYLKEYRTFAAMSATWGLHEDTISKKIWQILQILSGSLKEVFSN